MGKRFLALASALQFLSLTNSAQAARQQRVHCQAQQVSFEVDIVLTSRTAGTLRILSRESDPSSTRGVIRMNHLVVTNDTWWIFSARDGQHAYRLYFPTRKLMKETRPFRAVLRSRDDYDLSCQASMSSDE